VEYSIRENAFVFWPIPAFIVSTLLFLAGIFLLWWLDRHLNLGTPIPLARPDPKSPLISVIIPARNESRNICRCIESLQAQTYPHWEAIVINDHSTDNTPDVVAQFAARDPRIRLLHSDPLPDNWVGKPHALTQGAREARGDWLCFLDADTFASPDLLTSTYAEAQGHSADLLSILTLQELESFWERVISPVAFSGASLVYNFERINDPRQPDAMAIGQFILIRRKTYDEIGGHFALRDSILEDRALAEIVKRSGHTILLKDGRTLASTRMHTSLREIWESWVKTIYPGMRDYPQVILLAAAAVILGVCIYIFWWIAAAAGWVLGGNLAADIIFLEASLFWILFLWKRSIDAASYRIPRWYALTAPVGIICFGAMILDSYYRALSGHGFAWKGRTYKTK
jgi:chlorobactene glucosyltransferase